jgi:hypothetical protein
MERVAFYGLAYLVIRIIKTLIYIPVGKNIF